MLLWLSIHHPETALYKVCVEYIRYCVQERGTLFERRKKKILLNLFSGGGTMG